MPKKQQLRPYLIAISLFLVLLFTQPTISTGSQIVFDYIARFLICLLIGFGINKLISRKKKI
jgi:hypothetical protein